MVYSFFSHKLQQLSQMRPPKPAFTEDNLPDLGDRVYIVTGANTGVGKELAQMLYAKNARVYVAARNEEKANAAIEDIRQQCPSSTGLLRFLHLDLADITTISASAKYFLDREDKLHVLFNNAGVMDPPKGSVTKQGYELQLGVNNIGTYHFTKLLTPTLAATAAQRETPKNTVRVVWVASQAAEAGPKGGIDMSKVHDHTQHIPLYAYFLSKGGNVLHAQEYARQNKREGIVSVPVNPGNLDSELYRGLSTVVRTLMRWTILYPSKYGAYSELFAGLSPEVTIEKSGEWIGPWGRFVMLRKDMVEAGKSKEEGGSGRAREFTDWTDDQINKHTQHERA